MELHAITDGKKTNEELKEIIVSISGIVDYIHIREKHKSPAELMVLIEELIHAGVAKERLVINDRLDVALLAGIPNIHLPANGLPAVKVKTAYPHMRVGVSTHSPEEAKAAEEAGADYCIFGHIFETDSKKGLAGRGLDALGEVVEKVKIPVIAIGGITPANAKKVLEKKARGIAVMSHIFSSNQPKEAAALLKKDFEGGARLQLYINGQKTEVEDHVQNVEDLLNFFKLQDRIVVVEQNGEIVLKEQYGNQPVNEGDKIEIVHFVGGG
ncbi:thiazole tautomerase TenI [Ureibacillus sp. FSL K6-8385]|uniref:thiazole tautomerase TenI n=1 Tax=Ureibacillus sp. FSL K6-8385 TaxID=2954684 RepID=UPI003158F866